MPASAPTIRATVRLRAARVSSLTTRFRSTPLCERCTRTLRLTLPGHRSAWFLCRVLGIDEIYPYADNLSSINVHFASEGMELGWHFDNSSFAVTMLLQAPEAGGVFEYVPAVRGADSDDTEFARVGDVLDGAEPVNILRFEPSDLVLFRGREALHRITPTKGSVTRMLVVFAFNDQPNVGLSDSALETFYGRTS